MMSGITRTRAWQILQELRRLRRQTAGEEVKGPEDVAELESAQTMAAIAAGDDSAGALCERSMQKACTALLSLSRVSAVQC